MEFWWKWGNTQQRTASQNTFQENQNYTDELIITEVLNGFNFGSGDLLPVIELLTSDKMRNNNSMSKLIDDLF